MTHPNAMELEALACGESARESETVVAHVEACAPCRGFVARARQAAEERPHADLAAILSAARRSEQNRRVALRSGGFLLAAAAGLLVLVGARGVGRPQPVPAAPTVAEVMTTRMDTTFKGAIQVGVIRERGALQERFAGTVRVRPGDRLRIEVALDRSRAILGVVVDEDGSYLELMADGVRDPGTHFSDKSARVDARPMNGTILVGSPEAVSRARATGNLEDVASVRVVWEASP